MGTKFSSDEPERKSRTELPTIVINEYPKTVGNDLRANNLIDGKPDLTRLEL